MVGVSAGIRMVAIGGGIGNLVRICGRTWHCGGSACIWCNRLLPMAKRAGTDGLAAVHMFYKAQDGWK